MGFLDRLMGKADVTKTLPMPEVGLPPAPPSESVFANFYASLQQDPTRYARVLERLEAFLPM